MHRSGTATTHVSSRADLEHERTFHFDRPRRLLRAHRLRRPARTLARHAQGAASAASAGDSLRKSRLAARPARAARRRIDPAEARRRGPRRLLLRAQPAVSRRARCARLSHSQSRRTCRVGQDRCRNAAAHAHATAGRSGRPHLSRGCRFRRHDAHRAAAFETGREQATPHEPFRIDRVDAGDYPAASQARRRLDAALPLRPRTAIRHRLRGGEPLSSRLIRRRFSCTT